MGNRENSVDTDGNWTYNANNELEGFDDTTFQYDANGNMIEKNVGGVITKFFYNLEDRLERVEDGDGNVIAGYYYDPFGRRLWKEVGGVRTCFGYSDEGLVGEYDATGAEIKEYGWKPGGTWSTDPLFMRDQSGKYFWYHNDHLYTPQMMATSSGAVVWKAKYSSFGKAEVDSASTVVNPLRFPGQYEDAETGLHYNYQRYYDAELGRYIRSDPIGFWGGINFFAYVQNDPVNLIDPDGQMPIIVIPIVWAIIEAGLSAYDIYDTASTLADPCSSDFDKGAAIGGLVMGMVLPGGGYGTGLKFTKRLLSSSELIAKGRNIRKVDTLVEKFGGKAKDWKKMKGWDDRGNEFHWYENKGNRVGLKPAGEPDPF